MRTHARRLAAATLLLVSAALAPPSAESVTAGLAAQPEVAPAGTVADLFDGDRLHDVWLHVNARDWARLRAAPDENTYYPCDFEWHGVKAYNAGCRSRGSYTRNGIKPGIRVEFDHYIAGQTFLGLRSLVLRNLWQDPSMLKERLAMQVFRQMGVPAPREAHARLFVGSTRAYGGVYVLVEDIDERFLAGWADPGGYLFEYRWVGPYGFEDLGPALDAYQARFEPRTHRTASTFELYAPIRDLVRAIEDAPPERLEEALAPYLDLTTFLTHVAVENFLSSWDGLLGSWGLNNFYLYRPAGSTRAVLIPWDQDNSFIWLDMPPWHNVEANALMRKVWASAPLRAFYLHQLTAAATLSGWMMEEIDREAALIQAAVAADPLKNSSTAEFEAAVQELRQFAEQRARVVGRYLSLLPGADGGPATIASARQ